MVPQERFRWSLWPISVGWALALWLAWDGLDDLKRLLAGVYPWRGLVFGFVSDWPWGWQPRRKGSFAHLRHGRCG